MTKDIYISDKMYTDFLSFYHYLYEELEKQVFLYEQEGHYKRVIEIKEKKGALLRLHNQKYLKKAIVRYKEFLDGIYARDVLDNRMRGIILCGEEQLLVVEKKTKVVPLVVGKMKYLVDVLKVLEQKILVLTEDDTISDDLRKGLLEKELSGVLVQSVEKQELSLLEVNETLLGYEEMYQILSGYLMNDLFRDKERFDQLYEAFRYYIYLNRDYHDFETFRDYHTYMYKRKYLATGLSLKKYNKQEVGLRKTYLRTILNETVSRKEEVDIANFLYLNSVVYQYDKGRSCFYVFHDEDKVMLQYLMGSSEEQEVFALEDDGIRLYSSYIEKTSYLKELAYELIKRRIPLELRREEEIYRTLKETSMDSYFYEFITKCFIPAYEYYQRYGSFEETKLTEVQGQEIMKLYSYFQGYLEEHGKINRRQVEQRILENIEREGYEYVFLVGDISIVPKTRYMKVIFDYLDQGLLKGNVQAMYDYRKFLSLKRTLAVPHVYLGERELGAYTAEFLKDKLDSINRSLQRMKKEIVVRFYDDRNRLCIGKELALGLNEVFLGISSEKVLLAFRSYEEVKLIIERPYFSKVDRNTVVTQKGKRVDCAEIFSVSKNYDYIILPYLIMDRYHEEYFARNYLYRVKLMLYGVLQHSREGIVIMCPVSKRKEVSNLLKCFQNVYFCSS